jgi:hypothetical protein
VADPSVVREERRQVRLYDKIGQATFLDGCLWALDLGPDVTNRSALPLPREIDKTADRLTEYIEFLRFVRAEVRRLRDGAQEMTDD